MDIQAEIKVLRSAVGALFFLTDGSRLFDIDDELAQELEVSVAAGVLPFGVRELIGNSDERRYVSETPISPPPLRSISLNVAQACNMSCGYCYADRGHFGGKARTMNESVARRSVERLFADAPPNSDLVIGFMGGEPFLNRALIYGATAHAAALARETGHRVRFSLTTNGSLLTEEDAAFLASYPFSVTVSMDGDAATNDRHRKLPNGTSAYARTEAGLRLLIGRNRPRHVSIRATVSPLTGPLSPLLEHFFALGVDEAGFAPVISAPKGFPIYSANSFADFTAEMIACGQRAKAELLAQRRYPFSNFETALHEIHRGTHRPYPCGAGAGYMSVGSDGDYFACHRLVDDPAFRFGDLEHGIDGASRQLHLTRMHVDRQEPCRSCWARYLCGGGCYHEVARRGRQACDYIRAWLTFCLSSYSEVHHFRPSYFQNPHDTSGGEL